MRKKPNLIPRMQRCAALHVLAPEEERGHWLGRMPAARALHVELGCGKGRFTAEMAAVHPDVLFVAVERVPEAMVVAMERCLAAELTNVLFVVGDAACLPDFFAPGEVDRLYVNFCDPWPSKRHAKRRLTNRAFLSAYRKALRPGAEIHFKTDNPPLFEYSLEEFPAAGFRTAEITRDLHAAGPVGVMTDYEAKFYAEGVPICRCVAVLEE